LGGELSETGRVGFSRGQPVCRVPRHKGGGCAQNLEQRTMNGAMGTYRHCKLAGRLV